MNKIIIFIFLSLSLISYSQKNEDLTEKQRLFYTKIMHGTDSIKVNKKTHYVFKESDFKESDFFNKPITNVEIEKSNKLIRETGKLEIKKVRNEYKLILSGKLPERFNKQVIGVFSIELINNQLKEKNGKIFELYRHYNSNSGYGKIEKEIAIKSKYTDFENISGYIDFEFKYLIGYDKVKMSKKNIGKVFEINNCDFKLVNIKNNELILEKKQDRDIELNVINFSKTGKVIKPYSYMELSKLIKKDSTIEMAFFNRSNREVYKSVYQLFEKKPKITLKEFREIFTIEKLKEMKSNNEKYIIVSSLAPFDNEFILYAPIYKTEKIRIKY